MDLVLLVDWNGFPSGRPLYGVQAGQAEIMIQRGIAKRVESNPDNSKRSNVRTSDTRSGKKAT
jgi:hypothetical protein